MAGIYLSVGKLSADTLTLKVTENHIGMTVPAGSDSPKPNTFEFKKLSD